MKKTKLTRSLLAACSIVALSAVMYGCVHSSGDDAPADDPMDTAMPPPEPTNVDMAGVDADAMAMAGTYMIPAGGMHTAGDVTFSCAAGGDACSVTVAADGSATSTGGMVMAATSQAFMDAATISDLQGQINALRTQLGLDPADNLSDSITQLQSDLADLQEQLDDAEDEAAKMAAEAAAKVALALFNSFSDNVGTTDVADDVTVSVTAVSDTDGGGGSAEITATVAETTDGDDAGPNLGGQDVVRTAESMLGMWQGTMLTDADMDGNSSTAVVYTDVGPNVRKSWASIYTDIDIETVANLLGVNADAAVVSSAFSTAGLKDHHPDRNTTTNVVTVSGTFDGASGTYTCTSAAALACTSNMTADGVVLGGTGGWSFNPVDNAMVSQPDSSYAYFGWWLNKTAADNPEVDVFHGSNHPVEVASAAVFNALGDSATYKGAAIGKYALNRGADQYASGGHWTANATLTANFEDPDGADDAARIGAAGSISGMIDSFMAGGEMMDWSVELRSTDITIADGNDFAMATDGTIWTIGDADAAMDGSWSGGFHNQVAPPTGNNVPGTVTGEFIATYGAVGHMTGAFGAHVDE